MKIPDKNSVIIKIEDMKKYKDNFSHIITNQKNFIELLGSYDVPIQIQVDHSKLRSLIRYDDDIDIKNHMTIKYPDFSLILNQIIDLRRIISIAIKNNDHDLKEISANEINNLIDLTYSDKKMQICITPHKKESNIDNYLKLYTSSERRKKQSEINQIRYNLIDWLKQEGINAEIMNDNTFGIILKDPQNSALFYQELHTDFTIEIYHTN